MIARLMASNGCSGVGLLGTVVVVIVHTDEDGTIRVISMREADKDEQDLYFQQAGL